MARRSVIAAATLSAAGLIAGVALTHDALAGTTPAGTAAPAPVAAAPPAGISAEHFAALQRDLKLSPDQARTRIATDRKAGDVQAFYQAAKVRGYAGTYVEADGTVVVNVTDAAAGAQARAQGADVRVVGRSGAELDATVNRLNRARRPGGLVDWTPDVAGNAVVVRARTASAGAVRRWLARQSFNTSAIRVEATDEVVRPLVDIEGGEPYTIDNRSRCSVGFSVVGGFVTAGHCGGQGARTTGPGGTFTHSSFPGNDYARVSVTEANTTPTARVIAANGARVTVTGATPAAVGAGVCRSGSTTGWRCGVIQAYNATVNYAQGSVSGLIRTNVCAEPGDSGGSLVAGTQAQGLTSGGSGNCTSGGTTFFQPVVEALTATGAQLVTGGGPQPPVTQPPTQPTQPPTQPPGGSTSWAAGQTYATGAVVTFAGASYRCRQGHTAQIGWEPPNVPALWLRV